MSKKYLVAQKITNKSDHSDKLIKLMVKKHKVTGLKYLCKTVTENHKKYLGSGKRWKSHLKEHGRQVLTRVIFTTHSKSEFKQVAQMISKKWNVVDDPNWANLQPESGDGGDTWSGKKHSIESKQKVRNAKLGVPRSAETKAKLRKAHLGKKLTAEHKANMSAANKGRTNDIIACANIKEGMRKAKEYREQNGIPHGNKNKKKPPRSAEHRANLSVSHTGKKYSIVTCPHCGKSGAVNVMHLFHFHNCGKQEKQKACEHCGKIGSERTMKPHHYDNCKHKIKI